MYSSKIRNQEWGRCGIGKYEFKIKRGGERNDGEGNFKEAAMH